MGIKFTFEETDILVMNIEEDFDAIKEKQIAINEREMHNAEEIRIYLYNQAI